MMLAKLSLKNIKKSFKDYAIYFFTLILGVAIFYVFNAIDSQTVLLDVTSSTYEIIKLMTNLLSGVSVFVSFILGFLIIYASRFLIKRRNKEFGVYMTLGMGKRKISAILFFETIFIGIISLVVGLGIGVVLSQLMSLLVANMFEADMTKFSFIYSETACLKTLIYFGIMYLIVMLFNTIIVSRCQLIDLINGNRKSEKVRLKNPVMCVIIFIASCLVLGRAYYMVTAGIGELDTFDQIFKPIIMGAVSTFFIFWSVSGLILKICMSIKSLYYKGLNSFILRQFSSKINTMVFSMTVICLMLFVTICVLSSSLSIKNSMTANLEELAPADLQFSKIVDRNQYYNHPEDKQENYILDIKTTFERIGLMDYFKHYVDLDIYNVPTLTLGKSFGDKASYIQSKYLYLNMDSPEDIIKLSDYNKLAQFYGQEEYSLDEDEYMIVADFESFVQIRNEGLKGGTEIELLGRTLTPKYDECKNGIIEMSSNHINDGVFVIPDSVLEDANPFKNIFVANYKANDNEERRTVEEEIKKIMESHEGEYYVPTGTSKIEIAEASIGLGALVTFIGLYLGIIFLISSAAILALKELSESTDNKTRFKMLRKIGVDEHLINRALFRQTAIFFATPLILAIIHSIFGLKFCAFFLETFGTRELARSILMTVVFLVGIYGTYFLITYFSSKNIIKERY